MPERFVLNRFAAEPWIVTMMADGLSPQQIAERFGLPERYADDLYRIGNNSTLPLGAAELLLSFPCSRKPEECVRIVTLQ